MGVKKKIVKTFASLFTGGDGAGVGAKSAGLNPIWGIEIDSKIAAIAEQNLGHKIYCQDILEANPADFERLGWLHASPVCKAFSAANANKGEKEWDIKCGRKVAEFIEVLKPDYFSLENVRAYRDSEAFAIIIQALNANGYHCNTEVINSSDYGVPQSRERLFTIAYRGDFRWGWTPFTGSHRHVGWYEAIADLVHDLPDSQLAEWQIKALPDEIRSKLLIHPTDQRTMPVKEDISPSFTLTSLMGATSNYPRAILIENTGARSDRPLQTRDADQPSWTIRAMGQDGHWHRATALERGRVVQLDIRCLARLQSFPDWYRFPPKKSLAGTIIGNSVPPLLMKQLIQNTL